MWTGVAKIEGRAAVVSEGEEGERQRLVIAKVEEAESRAGGGRGGEACGKLRSMAGPPCGPS